MRLNISRKIISTILQIIMAISTIVFLISTLMSFTSADKNYFINNFSSKSFYEECDNQLNMKYEALSSETGIPARVFERVEESFETTDQLRQAAQSVFDAENETLYSENLVDYFYDLSTEYLSGNNISYNDADVMRASEKAAKIYSETVGLHNTEGVKARIENLASVFPKLTLASFILVFVCFPSIMVMYKRKKEGYFNAIGGILAGSMATALASLLLIIFNPGSGINILPEILHDALTINCIKAFLILAFISVIISVALISMMRFIDQRIQDED